MRERERESYGNLLLHIIMEIIVLWKSVCININKFFFLLLEKYFYFFVMMKALFEWRSRGIQSKGMEFLKY